MRPPGTIYRGELLFDGQLVKGESVTVDGEPLPLLPSLKLRNHSPTGFAWGYGGSGPAQLSLALLLDVTGDEGLALRAYQWFKWAVVIKWQERWEITAGDVVRWLRCWNREGEEAEAVEKGGAL
ncbi:Marine sediment metagenome DNA, contig: S06H3_S04230 (Fragment) OS=marine sediment metagenome GN=S06H3_31646 PE=4 SV=1 [Gemmata massiliana]|uniref:Marine sediment metagenome DNA, contig: S06H3_S04230 n=1 Tax=Gemmata massiliana TaxID=1210884 RepID=A0A6P2D440_9BACT